MINSNDLAAKSGATLRELQWWDERKILVPVGGIKGHQRSYSDEQIDIARRIVALRRAGVPLRMVRQCLETPGWGTVQAVDRMTIIGGVLLVPVPISASAYQRDIRSLPAPQPAKRAPQRSRYSPEVSDSEMDAIALRDPGIARQRTQAGL